MLCTHADMLQKIKLEPGLKLPKHTKATEETVPPYSLHALYAPRVPSTMSLPNYKWRIHHPFPVQSTSIFAHTIILKIIQFIFR